jgi:hypothetical protein
MDRASMLFFWALGCSSWFQAFLTLRSMMPGMVLRDVVLRRCFTWLLRLPTWGYCGWASLLPAPSYGMRPSDEGTGPPARHCLIPSLQWGGDAFPGDVKPWAWIFGGVLTMWIPVLLNLIWSKSSFTEDTYSL